MLKNQLFGIEVEMTGITREKAATIIAEIFRTIPSCPSSSCYKNTYYYRPKRPQMENNERFLNYSN